MTDTIDFERKRIDWELSYLAGMHPDEMTARREIAKAIKDTHGVDVPLDRIPLDVDVRSIQLTNGHETSLKRKGWRAWVLGRRVTSWSPPTYRRDYLYISKGSFEWIAAPERIKTVWHN